MALVILLVSYLLVIYRCPTHLVVRFATILKIVFQVKYENQNIFIELLIPKTKPIAVGIVYKSPDQTSFLEILSDSLNSLKILSEGRDILGDLIINLYENGSTLREENKNVKRRK